MQVTASARLVRSVIVTSCMMSLALGAHVVGGGFLPAVPLLVGVALFILVPVAFLAGCRLSLPVLSGLLLSAQLLLHHIFEMLSGPAACAPQGGSGAGVHHAAVVAQCPPASPAGGHLVPHLIDVSAAPVMVIGHLLAVVVMIWVLSRGEDAFWSLLAWLRPLVELPVPVRVLGYPQLPEYAACPIAPPARRNVPPDARRGPPELVAQNVAVG